MVRYLSHVDQAGQQLFQRLLTSMASMEFADFDEFNETDLNDPALSQLLHLDLSILMLYVMPRCEEFFYGQCWWRNRFRNCCDIFDVQLTDIGFCFVFNSLIANGSKYVLFLSLPFVSLVTYTMYKGHAQHRLQE